MLAMVAKFAFKTKLLRFYRIAWLYFFEILCFAVNYLFSCLRSVNRVLIEGSDS